MEQTYALLSASKRSFDRYQKDLVLQNRDHRIASDSLKEFSNLVKPTQDYTVLGEFVEQVALFSEHLQQIADQLSSDISAQLLTPLDGMLEGDLAEAEFSKKRFNKVLSDYDAVTKRIAAMNAKGQANPQKMQEALREQEVLQQKFDTVGEQTQQTLSDVNHRVEFSMFHTLAQYVETYHMYFSRGAQLMEDASVNLGKYRHYSEKKREVLEAGGNSDQVRLEDIVANEGSTQPRDPLERAVLEMVDKERSYVRKLDTISKSYIQNIRVDDVLASKFSDEDHRTIFCNIEELLVIHKSLVIELENDLANYPNYRTGRILASYVPRFRAYIPYVRNYSQAINTLDQLELRSQSVRKFMRTMDRKNGLRGLLCEPTGRLANYVIGLTQIGKQSHPSGEEYAFIGDVTAELSKLVDELQEAQIVSNNIGTMLPVHNELSGFTQTLLEPSRVLRKETMLECHFTTAEGKMKTDLNKFYFCSDILIQAKKKSVLESAKQSGPEAHRKMAFMNSLVFEDASVDQLPDNEEAGLVNAFELRGAGQLNNGMVLSCSSPKDRADLVALISQLIEGSVTNPVFDVSLETCMMNQRDQNLDVPEVVTVTCEYLIRKGLPIEGIFRMSGAKREVTNIIAKFNRGENVILANETADEHTVAGVLKRWVRCLVEPLLTYQLTERFLSASLDARELRGLLESLPAVNLRTTTLLFNVLHLVCDQKEKNKMNSKNLAIVFAPGLLRREGASDFDTSHYEAAYSVIGYMIDHYEAIFSGLTASFAPPKSAAPSARVQPGSALNRELSQQMASRGRAPSLSAAGQGPGPVTPQMPPPPAHKMPMKKGRSTARSGPPGAKASPPDFQAPKMPPAGRRNSVTKLPPGPRKHSISSPPRSPSPAPALDTSADQIPGIGRPPCARCNEAIRGSGLKALGCAWHKDCFVCFECQQPFAGGKILQKEGKPYCETDFRRLFGGGSAGGNSKTCRACNENISGPFMKALDGFWHASHFVCKSCGGSVAEGYYEKDNYPYCGQCFTE